ncbi:MAG: HAD family hydrolase [Syntrophobacteraceae bacterium]
MDFDGVLCNSMDESLITSYNAYFGSEVNDLSDIDPAFRDFFYKHRYMVRPAGEFFLLLHAYQNSETVIGKERFLKLMAAFPQEMKEHTQSFYACRKRQQQKGFDHWLNLHELYPQCLDFLEKRKHPFYIATNKDRDSVVALSQHHGYRERIIGIYSKEIAIEKKILLERLFDDLGLDPLTRRVIFVDDHEGTLGELKELPLELYLASWGYTGEPESSSFKLIHSLDELP